LALEFIYRGGTNPARVALFPGAWNPPTRAHLEIARAARRFTDEVVWVLPRAFPHKQFEGAGFAARRRMLEKLISTSDGDGLSMAVSDGGLYAEIAAEAREFYGPNPEISLVCGRDAAERIAAWDYGTPGVFDEMVRRYRLLVAARHGEYEPPGRHSHRIVTLPMDKGWNDVSSSEVRRRIANGGDWRALVPPQITLLVEELYRPAIE
jgi:nicotinate-nucleotide adenylyltransferase